jgi:hypothetical protein
MPWHLAGKAGLARTLAWPLPKPITTIGAVAPDGPACVYAALARGGRIKIGMSARRDQRMAALKARLLFAQEVTQTAAKEVETLALRLLGHKRGDGEYVASVSPNQARDAIEQAYRIVGGYRHVDPRLSEAEACRERISRATIGA